MTTEINLKKTSLYPNHLSLDAKMTSFGGWLMPIQYEGILAEYQHTRERVSLFDISHMGEFIVEGDCLESGLDRVLTMSIVDMPIKSCRYGAMLNARGGVIDDLIVFRMDKDQWFLVVNAATVDKDMTHIKSNLSKYAQFRDVSDKTGKIDLQGPLSRDVLKSFVCDIEKLDYYTFDFFDLLGENVLISRTGYSGELGYEIYFPWESTPALWEELLKKNEVQAAGLGARDMLRLEVGYSLYGHELGEEISPLESGLSRFIDFDKEFIGKDVLLEQKSQGVSRKIVGVTSDNRRSPRAGNRIYSASHQDIGFVTSGTFSPAQQRGIGLCLIDSENASRGDNVFFGDEKNKHKALISSKIVYKKGSLKN